MGLFSRNKTPVKKTDPKTSSARASTARRSASRTSSDADIDSPIIPAEQLEALRKVKPGAVDWVLEQTQAEAEHRRAETIRVNDLIFFEHIVAQATVLILGVSGIWAGSWVANNGQPWIGLSIASVVMVSIAAIQLSARKKRP